MMAGLWVSVTLACEQSFLGEQFCRVSRSCFYLWGQNGERNLLQFFHNFPSFPTKNIKIRLQGGGALFSLLGL